jgi:hypothetical protein
MTNTAFKAWRETEEAKSALAEALKQGDFLRAIQYLRIKFPRSKGGLTLIQGHALAHRKGGTR